VSARTTAACSCKVQGCGVVVVEASRTHALVHEAVRHSFAGPWSCDSSYYLCHCKRDEALGDWQDCPSLLSPECLRVARTISRENGDDMRFEARYHCDPRNWLCCGPYPSLHDTKSQKHHDATTTT